MTTVCLSMIVKNEAARIERCLTSVLPYINRARFVDTGSTDDTFELIRDLFVHNDVPSLIHERAWVNFAHNRNEALTLAREEKRDYILLLDADHELVVGDPNYRAKLTAPAYNIWQEDHGTWYQNVRLVSTNLPCEYVGVTHEVLILPPGMEAETLPREMIYIKDHADGANRAEKYLRDIELLEASISVVVPNPRDIFYLAQSYRDAGNMTLAMDWYHWRTGMGGWEEESWYAQYQFARLMERSNTYTSQDITHAYLMAYARRPWRAEPLVHLARYWRERNEKALTLMFLQRAHAIKLPDEDKLFIEEGCYI